VEVQKVPLGPVKAHVLEILNALGVEEFIDSRRQHAVGLSSQYQLVTHCIQLD